MHPRIVAAAAPLPRLTATAVCSWVIFGLCLIILAIDASEASTLMSTLFSGPGRMAIITFALTAYRVTAMLKFLPEPLPAPLSGRTLGASLLAAAAITVAAFAAWAWGITAGTDWQHHVTHVLTAAGHALASSQLAGRLADCAERH